MKAMFPFLLLNVISSDFQGHGLKLLYLTSTNIDISKQDQEFREKYGENSREHQVTV